jgi:hypothetical protein
LKLLQKNLLKYKLIKKYIIFSVCRCLNFLAIISLFRVQYQILTSKESLRKLRQRHTENLEDERQQASNLKLNDNKLVNLNYQI